MNLFNRHIPLFVSLILYAVIWYLFNPTLGYMLDSDAVAYLTIAKRVADGDFLKSVNGLWSPLNSWFVAFFIRKGYDAWEVSKYLNFLFGLIILFQSYLLFILFNIKKIGLYILQFALSIAMVYMVYFQMFGDVLQLIFVLTYLYLLWKKENINISTTILYGVIMGFAVYAKAYSFLFFAVHWLFVLGYYYYQKKINLQKWILNYAVGILSMLLIISPWSYLLYKKYHQFSLNGFAGKLNMSWYINSGKTFKSDIKILIPPVYDDSPSFWEDPYLTQDNLSTPFTSLKHFFKWALRIIHTCIMAVFCFQEISFFSFAILFIAVYFYFFRKSKSNEDDKIKLLVLTICILPLGYLMMHIETRYIWLNIVLLMILGAVCINDFYHNHYLQKGYKIVYLLLGLSFLVFPVFSFQNLKNKNKDLFEIAAYLNQHNIHGKFTSNLDDAGRMWVVAYLSNNRFYTIEKNDFSEKELKNEIKQYGVEYYFLGMKKNNFNINIESMQFVGQTHDIKIYKIN